MRDLAIAVVALTLLAGNARAQTAAERRAILRGFERAVASYSQLWNCSEPTLAQATPVFTLPVAMVFRQLIAMELGDPFVPTISAPRPPMELHVVVCQVLPLAKSAPLPEAVADALPVLPAGLEYRFVDHDLVVRDIERNLVVAVLPDAIRRATTMTQDE